VVELSGMAARVVVVLLMVSRKVTRPVQGAGGERGRDAAGAVDDDVGAVRGGSGVVTPRPAMVWMLVDAAGGLQLADALVPGVSYGEERGGREGRAAGVSSVAAMAGPLSPEKP